MAQHMIKSTAIETMAEWKREQIQRERSKRAGVQMGIIAALSIIAIMAANV